MQERSGDTFALSVDGSNRDQGLVAGYLWLVWFKLLRANDIWATTAIREARDRRWQHYLFPQADYNLSLAAITSGTPGAGQDTLLYVGTVDLYRCSLAGGCTLRNTTNALSMDALHQPKWLRRSMLSPRWPLRASRWFLWGNDGGLWRSTDGVNQQAVPCSADDASHFQNLNGGMGSLAEVVSFAGSQRTMPGR